MNDTSQSIIIVGGGMVGLSLALLLAKADLNVTLLETIRYPQLDGDDVPYHSSFDARNTALSRRSVQIYHTLGLWQDLAQYSSPILQVHISEQGGFGKARLIAEQENVENFGYVIENAWFGRILLKAVQAESRIQLIDDICVKHIQQDEQTVYLTAQKNNTTIEQQFQCSLLIGADGRDSFCRQALGVGVDVHDYEQVAIVTTVQTSKAHQNIGFERFSTDGPLALLPLHQPNRRSVVWTVKKGTEQQWLGAENDAYFLSALQQTYGDRAGKFEKTGQRFCYPLSQVLAHQQAVGRVVLMGNAAHTLHPVAGQGFNLCLRDADVLVRYLRQQVALGKDIGDAQMLKDYEQARLTDQKRVIHFCDSVVKGFSHTNPLVKFARNVGLIAFDVVPKVKPTLANYAMGLKA